MLISGIFALFFSTISLNYNNSKGIKEIYLSECRSENTLDLIIDNFDIFHGGCMFSHGLGYFVDTFLELNLDPLSYWQLTFFELFDFLLLSFSFCAYLVT